MKHELTAVIVDDELLAIDFLQNCMQEFPQIKVVASCSKSREAAELIIALKPDLLFLDIKMPVISGFELLASIINQHQPYIIFTTAYDEYAIRAFEVNAVGYLLKPFSQEQFNATVQRFLSLYKERYYPQLYNGILNILAAQQKTDTYITRLPVREKQRIFYLQTADILYFEAAGDYVRAITTEKSHLLNESMQALEQKLSPDLFIRVHRSAIIGARHVKEFIPYSNGEYHIVMANNTQIKMSRNYRDNLLRVFKEL